MKLKICEIRNNDFCHWEGCRKFNCSAVVDSKQNYYGKWCDEHLKIVLGNWKKNEQIKMF